MTTKRLLINYLCQSGCGLVSREKGKWSKAYSLFNINLRVPLLIDVPGLEPGSTQEPVELVDLYPTTPLPPPPCGR